MHRPNTLPRALNVAHHTSAQPRPNTVHRRQRTSPVLLMTGLLLANATPALAASPALLQVQALMDTLPLMQSPEAYDELMYGEAGSTGMRATLPAWIAGHGHALPNTVERMVYLELRKASGDYMSLQLSASADPLVQAWQQDGALEAKNADGTSHWVVELPGMDGAGSTRWRAATAAPYVLMASADTSPGLPLANPAATTTSAASLIRAALSAHAALMGPDETPERFHVRFGGNRPALATSDPAPQHAAGVPDALSASILLATRADGTSRTTLILQWQDCGMPETALAALEDMKVTDAWTYTLAPDNGFCQMRLVSPPM